MGRWEPAVLGLACWLAVASAAKVGESPAEGSGQGRGSLSPPLSQTWKLGTGPSQGKTGRVTGRKSQTEKENPTTDVSAFPGRLLCISCFALRGITQAAR